ncbi:Cof-type HAD-IIB family hydrolase [Algoriphagus machipongonensis]|uniref:Cof protein n=1 Tax=Algoriphagus machipongonensis TaxID=388413 RepID=A3I239_9BACT|nr:Cof-type HAD-IIB family hydrolase [Algoriphagus machipongonensis]EAZ79443.1 Cof protein [Algoriphagus machipongonensis]
MNIKAFCSDIDGTLLNADRDLSPRLKSVVNKFPSDFPVILASSRMPNAMRHLVRDLQKPEQPLICYNGGYVISAEGEILDSVTIPVPLVAKILDLCKNTNIHVSLYQGEDWYEEKDDYWSQREIRNTKTNCTWLPGNEVVQLWSKGDSGAHKVMCMGDSQEISWLFGELHFEHGNDLHLYRSSDTYLEIAPRSISKATGLIKILDHAFDFGMESVIAFGDNYNDIDLLQSVGYGVAVGNARPEVKAVAKEITTTNKEDGVAIVLEKLFLQNP